MRRLITTRRALDDRRLRGVAMRRRDAVPAVVRGGLLSTVAAALLVATGLCFGAGGGVGAAKVSPAGYAQPLDASASASPSPSSSAAPSTEGDSICTPVGAGLTCKGTYGGDNAYDPTVATTQQVAAPPTVTVSQTTNLTHQVVNVSWADFTPSYRTSLVSSGEDFFNDVTVMECKGAVVDGKPTGPDYDGAYGTASAPNDCYNVTANGAVYGPANMVDTYTSTGGIDVQSYQPSTLSCSMPGAGTTCGTGSAQFEIETKLQNSFLGCDDTSPCYLVVMPNWGGDDGSNAGSGTQPVDPFQDMTYTANCGDHEFDGGGPFGSGFGTQFINDTSCTWNDRFVIPLSFAPTPTQYCPNNDYQFYADGSPELEQAMQQWLPAWCTAKPAVDFDFNSGVDEYTARSEFLSGSAAGSASADIALVTDPASSALTSGSSRKFTYAPIANTGIAIAYYLDDTATGQPVTNLKLDARLVAKLLTNSYSYSFGVCAQGQTAQSQTCDPAVAGNPTSILHDPEFYQLNPEYTAADFHDPTGVGDDTEPLVIAGDSDMTYELTRWIESDADAASFLAGQPDPWGMHVNTYFKTGETYPISDYVKLDPGFSQTEAQALLAGSPSNVQTMQATWNPITGQDNVDLDMLAWQPTGLTFDEPCVSGACDGNSGPSVYGQEHNDAETIGARTMFAVVDTGDSGAYEFPTAQLVNSAGNAEGPTTEAMTAALDSMKTNPDKITQYQDFSSTSPNAYPLTEVQYAMVPTCGVSSTKARAISDFLTDATTSQLFGTSTGELPAFGGYLSLTAAQQAQTLGAAQQVTSQTCTSPPPDTTVSGKNPGSNGSTGNPGNPNDAAAGNPAATTPGPGGTPAGAGLPSGSPLAAKSPTAKSTPATEPVALGMKGADDGGLASWMLPLALILGGLLVLGGPIAYLFGTSGAGASVKRPSFKRPSFTRGGTAASAGAGAAGASGAESPEAGDESTTGGADD